MLAIVILLLSALSALQLRGKQPVAYQLALRYSLRSPHLRGLLRLMQIGISGTDIESGRPSPDWPSLSTSEFQTSPE